MKNTLKLELEYSVRNFRNHINACTAEYTIRPVGRIADIVPDNYERKCKALASLDICDTLSTIAAHLKLSAENRSLGKFTFSDKAYFKNKQDGRMIVVAPASIEYH